MDDLFLHLICMLIQLLKYQIFTDQIMNDVFTRYKNFKSKNEQNRFDLYRIPPNLTQCLKHYECSRFGTEIELSTDPACECCTQRYKLPLPLCCPLKQVQKVSFSMGYFLDFLLRIVVYSVIIFLVNGIFNYVQLFDFCLRGHNNNNCYYILGMPFIKLQDFFTPAREWLDMITLVLISAFNIYLTYEYRMEHKKQLNSVQASDYTLMVSGVDHNLVTPQDIIGFFRGEGMPDIEVMLTHKINDYILAENRKCELRSRIAADCQDELRLIRYHQQLQQVQSRIQPVVRKFITKQQKDIRTDKVFIFFPNAELKQFCIQWYFNKSSFSRMIRHLFNWSKFQINRCQLFIEEIGEPTDIIWQNLEVLPNSRYFRVFISNLATLALLIISFIVIVLISKFQLQANDGDHEYYSYLCAAIITIINLLLSEIIAVLVKGEKWYTHTDIMSSILVKECIAMFLNSTLIPFSMFFWFRLKQNDERTLMENIVVIFGFNAVVSPLLMLVNLKSWYRYYKRLKIQNNPQFAITQKQANQLFEKVDFEINFKYAVVIKLLMMSTFYASIFPIGLLVGCVGFVFTRIISKYLLLRHSCLPNVSHRISHRVTVLLYYLPVIYSVGVVTNQYLVIGYVKWANIVGLIIGGSMTAGLVLFGEKFVRFWVNRKQEVLLIKPSRAEAIGKGMVDYKNTNPTSMGNTKHKDINYIQDKEQCMFNLNIYASRLFGR